ncbi:uncharacterized protein LOC123466378 [Daphnia magna]|uniref:uncharacterized protein LOC123466378 n=1 Tax=Daphnia magna TaxID=35525 RepID=UPI001E1BAF84|nr:uncharacterized protein LOC123466378 [Daphnia magna]
MIIPETQPDDSEPMTISMDPMEPNLGEVEPMETEKDGNLDIAGLQEVAFHSCPIIESRYRLLANVGPNKNGTAILIRHGLDYSRLLLEPDGRLISIDVNCFTFINIYAPSDIWKKLNKIEPGHTFYHPSCSSRLDRIYASRSFAENFGK